MVFRERRRNLGSFWTGDNRKQSSLLDHLCHHHQSLNLITMSYFFTFCPSQPFSPTRGCCPAVRRSRPTTCTGFLAGSWASPRPPARGSSCSGTGGTASSWSRCCNLRSCNWNTQIIIFYVIAATKSPDVMEGMGSIPTQCRAFFLSRSPQ